ncbi:MAG: OsmC family protein [Acidobacteriota bacterium]|nr:OsmC family protein [Acidobacteriota bacterium]
MPVRKANAVWEGGLKGGQGRVALGSGAWEGRYSFGSRFEQAGGTNPEELLAAAHAACFSMALSVGLERAGHPPRSVATSARVHLEKVGEGFKITHIELDTEAEVPGVDDSAFQEAARKAKEGCPLSQALASTEITLKARLHPSS